MRIPISRIYEIDAAKLLIKYRTTFNFRFFYYICTRNASSVEKYKQ